MDLGLFRVKETTRVAPDGHVKIDRTTKMTGQGQIYFINRFLGKNVEVA
jgi:anti-repressor protein